MAIFKYVCAAGIALALGGCAASNPPIPASSEDAAKMTLGEAKEIIQRQNMWVAEGYPAPIALEFTDASMQRHQYFPGGRHAVDQMCTYESMAPSVDSVQARLGVGGVKHKKAKTTSDTVQTQLADGKHTGELAYRVRLGCENRGVAAPTLDEAKQLAAALLRWKNSTLAERQAWRAQRQQEFAVLAEKYRAASPKPAIGEDVRRFKVMGETAVQEKRLPAAAAAYEDGLKIAPWWPEGQFNAALVLAELRYYDEAIDHMRKYLELAPGAPDARAAQDKIYAWQGAQAAR